MIAQSTKKKVKLHGGVTGVRIIDIIPPASKRNAKILKPVIVKMIDVIPPASRRKALMEERARRTPLKSPFILSPRAIRNLAMRAVVTTLIAGLNLSGLSAIGTTVARFNDVESSKDNLYTAGRVDFTLLQTPYSLPETAENLMSGETASSTVNVIPEASSNPFWYHASSTNFGVDLDFCQTLTLESALEGLPNYSGLLSDFISPATTTLDDWQFDISTNVNSYNSICTFDFDFNAWQERHNLPSFDPMGFSDTETVHNAVASKGFRINKIYYDVEEGETPNSCQARSKGYWANNEGCSGGSGSADWNDEVNTLSVTYSGVFGSTSGPAMCAELWTPNCPSGNTVAANLCKAKTHALADEMNVVSGKLDPNAIISGADNGSSAFDHLGLTALSTIGEALVAVETILASATSTISKLKNAATVAERVYTFYESENPNAPYCAYSGVSSDGASRGAEGENEWVEVYNQTDASLDLSDWKICDNASCNTIASSTSLVPANGFAVLTSSTTTWSFWDIQNGVVKIALGSLIGNGLSNDADMLTLKRPDDVVVDQMNYGVPDLGWTNYNADIWNPGSADVPEGHSLGRKPNGYDTNQPSDFTDLAMPIVLLTYPDQSGTLAWVWTHSYPFTWTATNQNGPDSDIKIDLYYIKDTDSTGTVTPSDPVLPIASNLPNTGTYTWTVPVGFMGYIWVKIVAKGPENVMLNSRMISGMIFDPFPEEMWDTDRSLIITSLREAGWIAEDYVPESLAEVEDIIALKSVIIVPEAPREDPDAPVITLAGENPARVPVGSSYMDVGATAVDVKGRMLMLDISENTVDTSTVGEYSVVWSVYDTDMVYASKTRTVIVYDPFIQGVLDIVATLSGDVLKGSESMANTLGTTVDDPSTEESVDAGDLDAVAETDESATVAGAAVAGNTGDSTSSTSVGTGTSTEPVTDDTASTTMDSMSDADENAGVKTAETESNTITSEIIDDVADDAATTTQETTSPEEDTATNSPEPASDTGTSGVETKENAPAPEADPNTATSQSPDTEDKKMEETTVELVPAEEVVPPQSE